MSKVAILAVLCAVSVSAQFVFERRPNENENRRISDDEPRVISELWEEGRINRDMHETPEDRRAGGFQNGNFAYTDGKLRTNLNNNPIEYSGRNFQQKFDSPYVVEEGAAFRRYDDRQSDVHSSQGRIIEDSYSAAEDTNFEGGRPVKSFEHRPVNQNVGEPTSSIHNSQHGHEQHNSNTRRVNNSQQSNQNTDYHNAQRDVRNNHQNTKQTTLTTITQKSEADSRNNKEPVTHSATNSTATDDNATNEKDLEREALEKDINNQITKMIFDASVQEVTPKNYIETTTKHIEAARNNSGKEDDRWIWNVTSTTENPSVDDRAAFVANECPSNQVRFNDVCVDKVK